MQRYKFYGIGIVLFLVFSNIGRTADSNNPPMPTAKEHLEGDGKLTGEAYEKGKQEIQKLRDEADKLWKEGKDDDANKKADEAQKKIDELEKKWDKPSKEEQEAIKKYLAEKEKQLKTKLKREGKDAITKSQSSTGGAEGTTVVLKNCDEIKAVIGGSLKEATSNMQNVGENRIDFCLLANGEKKEGPQCGNHALYLNGAGLITIPPKKSFSGDKGAAADQANVTVSVGDGSVLVPAKDEPKVVALALGGGQTAVDIAVTTTNNNVTTTDHVGFLATREEIKDSDGNTVSNEVKSDVVQAASARAAVEEIAADNPRVPTGGNIIHGYGDDKFVIIDGELVKLGPPKHPEVEEIPENDQRVPTGGHIIHGTGGDRFVIINGKLHKLGPAQKEDVKEIDWGALPKMPEGSRVIVRGAQWGTVDEEGNFTPRGWLTQTTEKEPEFFVTERIGPRKGPKTRVQGSMIEAFNPETGKWEPIALLSQAAQSGASKSESSESEESPAGGPRAHGTDGDYMLVGGKWVKIEPPSAAGPRVHGADGDYELIEGKWVLVNPKYRTLSSNNSDQSGSSLVLSNNQLQGLFAFNAEGAGALKGVEEDPCAGPEGLLALGCVQEENKDQESTPKTAPQKGKGG